MRPHLITIHEAAQRLASKVSDIDVPSLAAHGFDEADARYGYQTMPHRNGIVEAIKSGRIRMLDQFSLAPVSWHKDMSDTQLVRLDDFLAFAGQLELDRRGPAHPSPGPKGNTGETLAVPRRQARIAAIVETARQLQYDPMLVPLGGKVTIERECLEKLKGEPHRFTADTFKSAWQAARDAGQIDVQNAKIYRRQ